MRYLFVLSTLIVFMGGIADYLYSQNYPVDPQLGFSTGPAVGEKVPDFYLPNKNNEVRALHDMVGQKGAVLIFLRSASW